MRKEIFILGVGGQGALTLGELLCLAGNRKGYSVSLYPFYGSQMRGGEAGCVVRLDTEGGEIANPTLNRPDDFLILSGTFLEKYRKFAGPEAVCYLAPESRERNLNLILLKRYMEETKLFTDEEMEEALGEKFRREEVRAARTAFYRAAETDQVILRRGGEALVRAQSRV